MSAREPVHLTEQQIDDHADGVLGGVERMRADEHLATCERCRRAVDETRAVLAWAERERGTVRAPAELWPLVAASTIHLGAVRRRVLASMRGMLVVGALALVAATAMITWRVARWTTAPRDVAPRAVVPHPVEGQHRSGSHPIAPIAPLPPSAPRPTSP